MSSHNTPKKKRGGGVRPSTIRPRTIRPSTIWAHSWPPAPAPRRRPRTTPAPGRRRRPARTSVRPGSALPPAAPRRRPPSGRRAPCRRGPAPRPPPDRVACRLAVRAPRLASRWPAPARRRPVGARSRTVAFLGFSSFTCSWAALWSQALSWRWNEYFTRRYRVRIALVRP